MIINQWKVCVTLTDWQPAKLASGNVAGVLVAADRQLALTIV